MSVFFANKKCLHGMVTIFLQFFLSKQMVILYFDVAVAFCSWMLRMRGMKHDDVNL
jgi:hypothetical protein